MSLRVNYLEDKKILKIYAPPTRPDVLHPCDIQEDVAIAYGYNKIAKTVPILGTTGKELPVNKLSDLLRGVIAEAGYMEVLTWALVSRKENYDLLNRKDPGNEAVSLDKPKTKEFEVVRTNLLSSLFKVLLASKGVALPVKIFEVGHVAFIDETSDVGSRNRRHLSAIYSGKTSGLERIHALVDRIMLVNNIKWYGELTSEQKEQLSFTPSYEKKNPSSSSSLGKEGKYPTPGKEGTTSEKEIPKKKKKPQLPPKYVYYVDDGDDSTFFEGRRAYIYLNGKKNWKFWNCTSFSM